MELGSGKWEVTPFEFELPTRIIFGPGQIARLGSLTEELGATRILVVSDSGIVEAGHVGRAMEWLDRSGRTSRVFDGVEENPTTLHVEAGLEIARDLRPDLIVGLGGGSSMDCAKGINFLYSCGGRMQDYWGVGKATGPMLPSIAVPTTAGTGSETQSFALISEGDSHTKMACGDKRASFRVALLDPELTLTQPARVTAVTGIDAMAHALETYVTNRRTPVSLALSREAWRRLSEHLEIVLQDPSNIHARGQLQLGACLAGLAIENSMLGATHALANPLTARFGLVHGQAIAIMLPHVVKYNGHEFGPWYRDLLEVSSGTNGCPRPDQGAAGLAAFVADVVQKAGLCGRLSECGIGRSDLCQLAADAARQWTVKFNPRTVGEPELLALYEKAL